LLLSAVTVEESSERAIITKIKDPNIFFIKLNGGEGI